MIKELTIKNSKSHKNTSIKVGNLTLLCGMNGVGKSTEIQSLLLLRQTFLKKRLEEVIELNDTLCDVGNANDAFYQYAKEENIFMEFNIKTEENNYLWTFKFDDNDSTATFMEVSESETDKSKLSHLNLFTNNFQYLSADRLGPQESYPKDDFEVRRNRQISIEKGRGELVAHFLHEYQSEDVKIESLLNNRTELKDLLSQTTAWEREISENINVKVVDNGGRNYEIRYSFDVPNGFPTNDFRSENVGYGVTYTLPIIVAILTAKPNSLIIIENPEAHLHPSAINKLVELLALAAQAGVQIILETHSDHVINSAMVQCKLFEETQRGIDKDNLKIYYFERDESGHAANPIEVEVLAKGRLGKVPVGFFDQFKKDLRILMRP
jgi:predicted ATPase